MIARAETGFIPLTQTDVQSQGQAHAGEPGTNYLEENSVL
jgi:hypothetical protein